MVSGDVSATLAGNQLEIIPANNWNGTAVITAVVHDGKGGADTESIQLTVTPANDLPVLTQVGNQETDEDTDKTLTVQASDIDGDNLAYSVNVESGDITATLVGNALELAPDPDWNGTAQLTIRVTDGNGGNVAESIEVVVNAVNDAPVITTISGHPQKQELPRPSPLPRT